MLTLHALFSNVLFRHYIHVSIHVWAEGTGVDIAVSFHSHIATFLISNLLIGSQNLSYQPVCYTRVIDTGMASVAQPKIIYDGM